MNISAYIFGSFGSGYSQYPSDYTNAVFQVFYSQSSAPTQIIVHRDDKLIYYGYIRKLEAGQYIGLCIVLNGIMLTDFKMMFEIFQSTITNLVVNGVILQFNNQGNIISKISQLYANKMEVMRITDYLRHEFEKMESSSKNLPPVSYSIAKNEKKFFSIEDSIGDIISASTSYSYTIILKQKEYDSLSLGSYRSVLARINKENKELQKINQELKSQNSKLRSKQRNTLWVGILSVAVVALFVILYFKVINPSEVTRYETGEFLYYGPLKDKKPDGEGVAFYPQSDSAGRRYYIGRFVNGERHDSTAMLYYQNGDYFYGSMVGDKWERGIFYSNSDNSHFVGGFMDNKPYDGVWYYHDVSYKLREGKRIRK